MDFAHERALRREGFGSRAIAAVESVGLARHEFLTAPAPADDPDGVEVGEPFTLPADSYIIGLTIEATRADGNDDVTVDVVREGETAGLVTATLVAGDGFTIGGSGASGVILQEEATLRLLVKASDGAAGAPSGDVEIASARVTYAPF